MTEALITADIVSWARERSKLSAADVAKRLNVKTERLEEWEKGETRPTFRQAEKLAKLLKIPFGYLFLPDPPEEKVAVPDLRTVGSTGAPPLSPDLIALLDWILEKQDWYRTYLREEGAEPRSFVGRFEANGKPVAVAEDIRATLSITRKTRRGASYDDYLRRLSRKAESVGILVLRSGIVGSHTRRKLAVEEFRGFAICDRWAPLVFVNTNDAKGAKLFTLVHELAHLWVGQSGISNVPPATPSGSLENVEHFCNRVAAEVLVPETEFRNSLENTSAPRLETLAGQFRVSREVILRRFFELRMIKAATFFERLKELRESEERVKARQEGEGGGDFYNLLLARNSTPLTRAIVSAAFEGKLPYRDAARFLAVRVPTLDSVAERLGLK